jgi:hypothetical protein
MELAFILMQITLFLGVFEMDFTVSPKNATSYSKDNTSPAQYPRELILLFL